MVAAAIGISFSNLPEELWTMIGGRLESHIDILRFRSVCSWWRSLLPPPTPKPSRFPLAIPDPAGTPTKLSIFRSTVYRLTPPPSSSGSPIMIKHFESEELSALDQDRKSQSCPKLKLRNVLSNRSIESETKLLNLINLRVAEVYNEYMLRDNRQWRIWQPEHDHYKVIMSPKSWTNVEDCTVIGISLAGRLRCWKFGWPNWTEIGQEGPNYDDIVFYGGQFYVLDRLGTVSWIDHSSMNLVQFSPPMAAGGDRKHLIEANGDLYIVDRYLRRRMTYADEWMNRKWWLDHEAVNFKLYRLNQEWGRWEQVRSLGRATFFLGRNSSFSVPFWDDSEESPENRIYYVQNFMGSSSIEEVNVFNVADRSITRLRSAPAYLQILWPPHYDPKYFESCDWFD